VTIRYGVPLIVAVLVAVKLLGARSHGTIRFGIGAESLVPAAAVLEVFPYDDSGIATCPPAPAAALTGEVGDGLALDAAGLPPRAIAVVRAEDGSRGWTYFDRSRPNVQVDLSAAVPLHGRVANSNGVGLSRVRVEVLAVDKYGPRLGAAETGVDGSYSIEGIGHGIVCVRAFHPGYSASAAGGLFRGDPIDLTLLTTRPVVGRVVAPPEVQLRDLELAVFRLPGVSTRVHEDGLFYLDQLPPSPTRARLLLQGLPPGFTHRQVLATAGDAELVIRVERACRARGRVVASGGAAVPGAFVMHNHGPRGVVGVHCGSGGEFELDAVPSGEVDIEAFSPESFRGGGLAGVRRETFEEGRDRSGIEVRVR
jgi:hypothetical protein